MARSGNAQPPNTETTTEKDGVLVPLQLKLLLILIVTALPPVALLVAEKFWPAGTLGVSLERVLGGTISAGGITVSFYLVLVGCIAVLGIGIGFILGDGVFVTPVKALARWLSETNEPHDSGVPIFPKLHRDEIGALGRGVSAMAARGLQVGEQDKTVTNEKSTFLMVAAHQLRTPISELTWSIEELLDPSTSEETKQKIIQNLSKPLKRTQLVIGHILATASIEEGRFGYVFEQVDIVPVIEKLVNDFALVAEEHGNSIVFEHGPVPLVYADAERISLALFDLITNAIDYTPRGGRITVSLKPASNDRVEVIVADTGIGIPEKELPFIFTKFHRGENALHMRPNGSGLGLYLVKNIINGHGSEVFVDSSETIGGTRFSFFLNTKPPA
ncbi:MAG TPA: HAMP domain-containing sensor histidine kinase [Candidatus Paceibacterota bacterium]|nr:HAMP domain-containing sensor histidine kinase [Candidatus Paceibacterota bacterium]